MHRSLIRVFYSLFFLVVALFFYGADVSGIEVPRVHRSVSAQTITVHTLYGTFNVSEPVLQELFFCDALTRIQNIHQYGFVRYLHPEVISYTRYVHCINVWAILRLFGASIEEQVVGLLHDVSHTVFSHVGDFVFNHSSAKRSYQDDIHKSFLIKMGVDKIIERFGYSMELFDQVAPRLEQDSPCVCADRFEYTVMAGLLTTQQNSRKTLINLDDVDKFIGALRFDETLSTWYFVDIVLAKKFAMISLETTERVVGSAWNHLIYSWMADAVCEAFKIGLISSEEYHYSFDSLVWERLNSSDNSAIVGALNKIKQYDKCYRLCGDNEPCDVIIHTKFRGIDPLVEVGGEYKNLSKVDKEFATEYERVRKAIVAGWRIKFIGICADKPQNIRQVIS